MSIMEYKGYCGNVCYSKEDDILHGEVLGIKSYLSYEGSNLQELEQDFHNAVDEYLDLTSRKGLTPETPDFGLSKLA